MLALLEREVLKKQFKRAALIAVLLIGASYGAGPVVADFDVGGENYYYDCRHDGVKDAWTEAPSECYWIHRHMPPEPESHPSTGAGCPPGASRKLHAGCVIHIIEEI